MMWSSLPAAPAITETHISVLFFVGDRAFKLKKPVELPFLDWRDRADRVAACHREVELNRRLAPDVYLGVGELAGPDDEWREPLVMMRRMPDDRRLSQMIADGHDVTSRLGELAVLIAEFHRSARRPSTSGRGAHQEVIRNWSDNLDALRAASAEGVLSAGDVDHVSGLASRYLAGREPLFEARVAGGHVVDGHGDLLADDIFLLDDGPRVLDCLDFDDRLRTLDVLDDVACLAMDLEQLGHPSPAELFLSRYLEAAGVAGPVSLTHHFIAYRAGVRSKIAALRTQQGDRAARDAARHLLDVAGRHLDAGRVRLVLVGGLPGTGKTTVASRLGDLTGWTVLHSDPVRKELAGVDAAAPMGAAYRQGLYQPAHTERTYAALLDRARAGLSLGETVVIDASWVDPDRRRDAHQIAEDTASDLIAVWCDAPAEVTERRIGERGDRGGSDATTEVARSLARDAAPWPGARRLDTSGTLDESLSALRLLVDA